MLQTATAKTENGIGCRSALATTHSTLYIQATISSAGYPSTLFQYDRASDHTSPTHIEYTHVAIS